VRISNLAELGCLDLAPLAEIPLNFLDEVVQANRLSGTRVKLAKLRDVGILEIKIPLKLFSDDRDDDISWTILADRDNQLVPNLDSEYGGAQLDIETWGDGEIVIHGDINLEYSAFPTMRKIQDAFPENRWKEAMGGGTIGEYEEWLANGKEFTAMQKKAVKFGRKKPGKDTAKARKAVIDPAFYAVYRAGKDIKRS
jgi:hypothetical protein